MAKDNQSICEKLLGNLYPNWADEEFEYKYIPSQYPIPCQYGYYCRNRSYCPYNHSPLDHAIFEAQRVLYESKCKLLELTEKNIYLESQLSKQKEENGQLRSNILDITNANRELLQKSTIIMNINETLRQELIDAKEMNKLLQQQAKSMAEYVNNTATTMINVPKGTRLVCQAKKCTNLAKLQLILRNGSKVFVCNKCYEHGKDIVL